MLTEIMRQIWCELLKRRTLICQSTTLIKRTTLTNSRMKMRTIVMIVFFFWTWLRNSFISVYSILFLPAVFYYWITNLTLFKDTANMYERILLRWCRSSLTVFSRPFLNECWINIRKRVKEDLSTSSQSAHSEHTERSFDLCINKWWGRRLRKRWTVTCIKWVLLLVCSHNSVWMIVNERLMHVLITDS